MVEFRRQILIIVACRASIQLSWATACKQFLICVIHCEWQYKNVPFPSTLMQQLNNDIYSFSRGRDKAMPFEHSLFPSRSSQVWALTALSCQIWHWTQKQLWRFTCLSLSDLIVYLSSQDTWCWSSLSRVMFEKFTSSTVKKHDCNKT